MCINYVHIKSFDLFQFKALIIYLGYSCCLESLISIVSTIDFSDDDVPDGGGNEKLC